MSCRLSSQRCWRCRGSRSFLWATFLPILGLLLHVAPVDAQRSRLTDRPTSESISQPCPAYKRSDVFRSPKTTRIANSSNWIAAIEQSQSGDEVLLEDGLYRLDRYAVVLEKSLILRGRSGDRSRVVIEGTGYRDGAEALMVLSDDVTIADLSIRRVRNHGISIKTGVARTAVYNVDLEDVGTQHIKGSSVGPDGVIACSRIGYTENGVQGDYTGAIDLHGAVGWTIRDNLIYNIYGDGSGCEVDSACGAYLAGGGPAILLWNGARDNIIERNQILDSFRGISLGLGSNYSGGIVRNNFVFRSEAGRSGRHGWIEGDTGISLLGASGVQVDHNTVILAGNYPGAIELQDGYQNLVRNNLLSRPIWNRGNAEYNGCSNDGCEDGSFGNRVDGKEADLVRAGEPKLRGTSKARGFGLDNLDGVDRDIDGTPRSRTSPDSGCDELPATTRSPNLGPAR